MKVIKRIFLLLALLLMAGCAGILICAFNPQLTNALAEKMENLGLAQSGGNVNTQPEDLSGVNTDWTNRVGSYEPPATQPSDPPDSVSDRNGYEPVWEDAEQILEEEAQNLAGILAPGDTGSGLSFDSLYYPYYAMLEQDMQQLYRQIYANAQSLTTSFTPVTPVSVDQLKNVFEAVYNDHPELFWLEAGYSCKYLRTGSCVEITLEYNNTADDLATAKRVFQGAAEQILSAARTIDGDYNRERYIHDVLMQIVGYDANAATSQSAYSALVNGRTVCAGYARAFQYLMQQLRVPCYYCTGYTGEDHAWNIIKIGDIYYNVDVTWDDTDTPTYDYFNKTDREIAGTHMRTGLSLYLPACVVNAGNAQVPTQDVLDVINPNPTEPLVWESKNPSNDKDADMTTEERKQANLDKAGITADQVRETIQEYYQDCLELLVKEGVGDKQFSNVIPDTLWSVVERAYSTGSYMDGYMKKALEELGVEEHVIQLQVQRLGGGYYRLYHNIYTY